MTCLCSCRISLCNIFTYFGRYLNYQDKAVVTNKGGKAAKLPVKESSSEEEDSSSDEVSWTLWNLDIILFQHVIY